MKNIAAIILAAGKGTRINANNINKVMFHLGGKPMLYYTIELVKKVGIKKIVIVVGHAKTSIINYFGKDYIYAEQKKRLGTAHALKCALSKLTPNIKNIFACYSDDTAFYPSKIIKKLIVAHVSSDVSLTLLTVKKKDPTGLGRILRDSSGKIIGIIEEKNATVSQKRINEINTGCYCFKVDFIKKYINKIKKNILTEEYYLTDLIELAIKYKEPVAVVKMSNEDYFEGINTKDQWQKANLRMITRLKQEV